MKFSPLKLLAIAVGAVSITAPALGCGAPVSDALPAVKDKFAALAAHMGTMVAGQVDGQNITIKAALEVQAAIQKATDTAGKCTGAILDGDVEVIVGHLSGIHAHVKSTISNFTQAGGVLNVELVVDHMMTIDLHLKVLLKSMHGIS
ncbi:hypothetical protein IE81DRAFT_115559 [Ceraceosorus guamensis]|uniref:Lipoprotein n=1 Tax=Ceraceosorus guamensis TaxID=1522189 RepID=A0A316VYS2_9BASI|nr:hypothetical protein IE81DRAFT_115559 [Ceraceosorus guamensis]PWN42786.1 hypothetical protein IE81DRAFT_115559 [Ceraceosorus guamensis]